MSKENFMDQVKAFRAKTKAPLGRCMQVLREANGDEAEALKLLRREEMKAAGKKSERDTNDGVVFALISDDKKKIALVEVTCETESVAKNEIFTDFVFKISTALLKASSDISSRDAFLALSVDKEHTVESYRMAQIGVLGENVQVSRHIVLETDGFWSSYRHGMRIVVALALEKEDDALGRGLAMHVAAMKPRAVDAHDFPQEERDAAMAKFRQEAIDSGKPEAIVDKIAQGKFAKWLGELTLSGQVFIKELEKSASEQRKVGVCLQDAGNRVLAFRTMTLHEPDQA